MRILVGWDESAEAETIRTFLNLDGDFAEVVTEEREFERALVESHWDVLIQALSFPRQEDSLDLFERAQSLNGSAPVIGIWRQDEIADLARFMESGLHSHLMRDANGNFVFLLASMASAAEESVKTQHAALLAERLRHEVDSVRRLQESVIPRRLPQPDGYHLAARYESSEINVTGFVPVAMAGGDYYDVFDVSEKSLALIVGDASGHGIKACMSIMTMHTLIRTIDWREFEETGEFVSEINRRLCASDIVQDEGGFITLLCSKLDLEENRLQWTSAGSPLPLVQDLKTNQIATLSPEHYAGLPLAIESSWQYQQFQLDVPKHSRVLVYTDGLEEAFPMDSDCHDQFGMQGIIKALQDTVDQPLDVALDRLFADSQEFTRGSGRMDDTSVLLVERV